MHRPSLLISNAKQACAHSFRLMRGSKQAVAVTQRLISSRTLIAAEIVSALGLNLYQLWLVFLFSSELN